MSAGTYDSGPSSEFMQRSIKVVSLSDKYGILVGSRAFLTEPSIVPFLPKHVFHSQLYKPLAGGGEFSLADPASIGAIHYISMHISCTLKLNFAESIIKIVNHQES